MVSIVDSYRGSESLRPGLLPVDSLTLRASVLPTAGFFHYHSLDFTGISRHKNAFVGVTSFGALKGGTEVPWLCLSIWNPF